MATSDRGNAEDADIFEGRILFGSNAHLGRGWGFPLRWHGADQAARKSGMITRATGAGVNLATGEEDVRQAIRIILGTRLGERVLRPDFGSRLHDYVFEPINSRTLNLIAAEVKRALTVWERRITDINVKSHQSPDEASRVDVEIAYRIDSHRIRRNLVYPFYVNQPEGT